VVLVLHATGARKTTLLTLSHIQLNLEKFTNYGFKSFNFYIRQLFGPNKSMCCGSGRFLTGSDFRKRPDPDPDLNKISANFLLEIFLAEICFKKYIINQKVKQHRFLKYFRLFHTRKKLIYSHLLRPESGPGSDPRRPDQDPVPDVRNRIRSQTSGSGSDQKGPDPDPTKKFRIRPDPDPQHLLRLI
jgi:hypothetical protein